MIRNDQIYNLPKILKRNTAYALYTQPKDTPVPACPFLHIKRIVKIPSTVFNGVRSRICLTFLRPPLGTVPAVSASETQSKLHDARTPALLPPVGSVGAGPTPVPLPCWCCIFRIALCPYRSLIGGIEMFPSSDKYTQHVPVFPRIAPSYEKTYSTAITWAYCMDGSRSRALRGKKAIQWYKPGPV